jgi:hypothetical protein
MSDSYDNGYAESRERFERDTAEHEMTVLHDDGLYRHIRFQAPGTSFYYYDLVTWPGHLVICGDMGDYHFARLRDMFTFFGAGAASTINPHYWGEKLQGTRPGREGAMTYSEGVFHAVVIDWFEQQTGLRASNGTIASWAVDDEAPNCLVDQWTVGTALALSRALEADVLEGGFEFDTSHERGARDAMETFEFPTRDGLWRMHDVWEYNLRDYDGSFLWACWAIVRGIERYRAAVSAEVAA